MIEFNCPYCTALIRVPDNAGGGKGRCPKCATRIRVPKTSTLNPIARPPVATASFAPPTEEEPVLLEAASDDRPREIENFFDPDYDPKAVKTVASAPIDSSAASQRPPGEFPFAPPGQPVFPSSSGSTLKPKKRGGAWVWPLALGLLVCGAVAGWYIWQRFQGEQLGGELVAQTADSLELIPGLIEKSSIKRPADDVETVLSHLEKTPVPLLSGLMHVQLRGSSKGVLVYLNNGPQSRFYRVELRGNEPLTKYHSKHAAELEAERMQDLEQAATAFAIDYHKVIEKQADQSSITGYRNSLALPALVKGLGHQIVAAYGRTLYPCVYEDHEGALYFLLPPEAKAFEISGRKHVNDSVVFPATYKITVAGPMKVPAKKDGESADQSKDKKSKGKPGPVFKRSDESEEKMDSKDDAAMKNKDE